MIFIHDLQHTIVRETKRARKGIGHYTRSAEIEAAIRRVKDKPGFRDPRGFFSAHTFVVGQDYPQGIDALPFDSTVPEFDVASKQLYLLWSESAIDAPEHDDDFVLIGYYATEADAQAAQARMVALPSMSAPNRRFGISIAVVDRDNWTEGFGFDDD